MDANTALITGLRNSLEMLDMFIKDLSPDHMLHRPCDGANCAAWTVGHLVLVDRHFMKQLGVADADLPPLPEGFDKRFSQKENAPQAADFGDVSGLRDILRENRESFISAVEKMDAARLDEDRGNNHPFFKTVGSTLSFMSAHTAMHAGQITTIRRSLGMPPVI